MKKLKIAVSLLSALIFCLYAASCSGKGDESAEDIGDLMSVFSYDETEQKKNITYVLNKNTKKIHYLTCAAAETINAENYEETDDFSGALDRGYEPCEICRPAE